MIHTTVTVHCDAPGCKATTPSYLAAYAFEARAWARSNDWRIGGEHRTATSAPPTAHPNRQRRPSATVGTMARLIDAETARPEMASDRPPDHPYPYPVIVTLQTMAGWAAEHPDDDHSDHVHVSVRNPTRLPVS